MNRPESLGIETPIHGLLAVLPVHRDGDGSVDFSAVETNAEFPLSNGAVGIVRCCGAGDHFDLSIGERQEFLDVLAPFVRGRGYLVAGIGAARL